MSRRPRTSSQQIRGADRGYVAYHAPRYAFVLETLGALGAGVGSRILDVGPSRLTELLREVLGASVDTLGFGADREDAGGRHFEVDLDLPADRSAWRSGLPAYDYVVFAEVLEHLHTAPELVLEFLRSSLEPGGVLLLQTPNAAALPKRLKLLFGRNPYERIRVEPHNPGHFREYTLAELRGLAHELGFSVELCRTAFYFDARFAGHEGGEATASRLVGGVKNVLYRALPPRLREGVTMAWRRV